MRSISFACILFRCIPLATPLVMLACSSMTSAPFIGSGDDTGGRRESGNSDASTDSIISSTIDVNAPEVSCPAALTSTQCTCTELTAKPTTVYLILDHSGSMADVVPPATVSKWATIESALFDEQTGVLRQLGARLAVGVATFPSDDACGPGRQLTPLTTGSEDTYDTIARQLGYLGDPNGATPTAATITALTSTLQQLPAPVFAILATDGAPNCGTTTCTASMCTYNIESLTSYEGPCDVAFNCCDPANVPEGGGWQGCVDSTATEQAVTALANVGIKTFVIGVPGSEFYVDVLNQLAILGGTAQTGAATSYYAVADGSEASLIAALNAITAHILNTCSLTLDTEPADPNLTNLVVNGNVLPQDPVNGWTFATPMTIAFNGTSCAQIQAGSVTDIRVVFGCPTQITVQ